MNPLGYFTAVNPNLFLTVAQINVEKFPWPIPRSVAQLQFSNTRRFVCNLKKSQRTGNAIFCVFSRGFQKKKSSRNIFLQAW